MEQLPMYLEVLTLAGVGLVIALGARALVDALRAMALHLETTFGQVTDAEELRIKLQELALQVEGLPILWEDYSDKVRRSEERNRKQLSRARAASGEEPESDLESLGGVAPEVHGVPGQGGPDGAFPEADQGNGIAGLEGLEPERVAYFLARMGGR